MSPRMSDKGGWMLVYMLILATLVALFFLVNGLERRRAQEVIAPTPSPRTTLIDPVTTTPFPSRSP